MEKLKPCPFCGGTDIHVQEHRLGPYMSGKLGALASVDIQHWCGGSMHDGKVAISARGRDLETARRAWNSRAALSKAEGGEGEDA